MPRSVACLLAAATFIAVADALPVVGDAATAVQDTVESYKAKGYSYSRSANPTRTQLEKALGEVPAQHGCERPLGERQGQLALIGINLNSTPFEQREVYGAS